MTKPRIEEPQRKQGEIRFEIPEDMLPADHRARVLWEVLGKLDLSLYLTKVKSFEGGSGRSAKSPRMLLTLWTYAVSLGVGSAREIERRVKSDLAFGWITGGKSVSRQTLRNFLNRHPEALQRVFSNVIAVLMRDGLLELETVGIDGMRVRASASAPSFRSRPALEETREQAALHLKAVMAQQDDPSLSRKQKAVRAQKAREFRDRVDAALGAIEELEQRPKPPKVPRASTTDAEARVMKMANGGFRPGFNVQLATAGKPMGGPRTIVAVRVTNVGSDMRSLQPVVEQIEERAGVLPARVLADANHANHAHIDALEKRGVELYVPPQRRSKTTNRHALRKLSPQQKLWMERMTTPAAKQLYRCRASLAELPNAMFRWRYGLEQFLVRGTQKVTTTAVLIAVTHNLLTHAEKLV